MGTIKRLTKYLTNDAEQYSNILLGNQTWDRLYCSRQNRAESGHWCENKAPNAKISCRHNNIFLPNLLKIDTAKPYFCKNEQFHDVIRWAEVATLQW